MKKKETFERKIWEARKAKFIKSELEYQDLQEKYHSHIIHEDDVWKINERFDHHHRVREQRRQQREEEAERKWQEKERRLFKPNVNKSKSQTRSRSPNVFDRLSQPPPSTSVSSICLQKQ